MASETRKPLALVAFAICLVTLLLVAGLPSTGAQFAPGAMAPAAASDAPLPPVASKIHVGPPGMSGYAEVTGEAGAVPRSAKLGIINLSSRNLITAQAASDGSFSASLFAPPGSTLLVKYAVGDSPSMEDDPIDRLWREAVNGTGGDWTYINALPGTTLYVEGQPPEGRDGVPYFAAGYSGDHDGPDWAGWWLEGRLAGGEGDGVLFNTGDELVLNGTMTLTSPAFECQEPLTLNPQLHFSLRYKFGTDGRPFAGEPWFNAQLFTPTGLPIEYEGYGEVTGAGNAALQNLRCIGPHTVRGNFQHITKIAPNVPSGHFQLEAWVDDGQLPKATGLPLVVIWYHHDAIARLPLITVGRAEPPRIPWTLLTNYPANGHQGLQALEDVSQVQFTQRSLFPPPLVVLPRTDAHSGKPITYRLEPASNWLSSTDRRFANPPPLPLVFPGGELQVTVTAPDGSTRVAGPAAIDQTAIWTPVLPEGGYLHEGTGHPGDIFQLYVQDNVFAHQFQQDGLHEIAVSGYVEDAHGRRYPINAHYELAVGRILDLDPAQLPVTPFEQGDAFAPGMHLFPPMPAEVAVTVTHLPYSDPELAQSKTFHGWANEAGIFQPPPGETFVFTAPGEFRVDYGAAYNTPEGSVWAGFATWGNVVEGPEALIEAHGRRGMDYTEPPIDNMPPWFFNADLPPEKMGIENYYPYFSGDIHWGEELAPPSRRGDSIHSIITVRDLSGPAHIIDNLLLQHFSRARNPYRNPPQVQSPTGLRQRLEIGEAPLFITTSSGRSPIVFPQEIDMWGYWYGASERPDVHVREVITGDSMGTAYWRFNDTYGRQIGEPADGDQPGDIKWEFGGAVLRVPDKELNEYAIYSSLWVMLPDGCDAIGCTRVTPPFQDATGAGINGGPILTLAGKEIDMLFLPKGVRPGDVLQVGDTVSFSGHVGPPLDSLVAVSIRAPSGKTWDRELRANKIGWTYDPAFDFNVQEAGIWTVEVEVVHDRPYVGNGVTPQSHNRGTVLGTQGSYHFYVVPPDAPLLALNSPQPGILTWSNNEITPLLIEGRAPAGTSEVHYTIHDKGIVMGQGAVKTDSLGRFQLIYDPVALHDQFSMLSLTSSEGLRRGLADEVTISMFGAGRLPRAAQVTLIGEEVFVRAAPGAPLEAIFLPAVSADD